jgi:hypothetical protein
MATAVPPPPQISAEHDPFDVGHRACPKCAVRLDPGDKFCPVCGAEFVAGEASVAQKAAGQQADPPARPGALGVKRYGAKTLAAAIILSSLLAMFGAVVLSNTVFAKAGPVGARGAVGARGPIGPIGPIGRPGRRGAQGRQGSIGAAGSNGSNGANGSTVTVPSGAQQQGTDSQGYAYGVDASGASCDDNPSVSQPNCPF